jgi:hypothetical protein
MTTTPLLDDPASAAGGRTHYHLPAAELPTAGKARAPVGGGSGYRDGDSGRPCLAVGNLSASDGEGVIVANGYQGQEQHKRRAL